MKNLDTILKRAEDLQDKFQSGVDCMEELISDVGFAQDESDKEDRLSNLESALGNAEETTKEIEEVQAQCAELVEWLQDRCSSLEGQIN